MLDIKFVRENPEVVKQNIRNKFQDSKLELVDKVIELDKENREIKQEVEALRAERNKISKQIGALMGQGKREEAEEVKKNIGAILNEAGTDYCSVVKTTCFLSDMNDFAAFNEVYAKYFTEKPARSCVAVKTLPKNVLCEVEVIAIVE